MPEMHTTEIDFLIPISYEFTSNKDNCSDFSMKLEAEGMRKLEEEQK